MLPSTGSALLISASFATAQLSHSDLTGTWSTKSNSTFTGPGFYDSAKDRLIEPSHTGISYSFTDDGHYEVSYYRAIANPVNPNCPRAIMQWQHGTFERLNNGSLVLTPIGVDGRQLMSDPCNMDSSIYSRYNQSELFERYEQFTDPYHNVPRLNLYRFDGSPLPAMYIAYKPPQMLPTSTLDPTGSATASTQATGISKMKRGLGIFPEVPKVNNNVWVDADRWWWFGVGATGLGSLLYICF